MEYKPFAWAAKLKTTIFYGTFYIDIPSGILNIISVNVHLFRKSQTSQNRKHYLHRKYRSDLGTVKIEASEGCTLEKAKTNDAAISKSVKSV